MTRKMPLTPQALSSLTPKPESYTIGDTLCPGLSIRVQPGGTLSWVMSRRIEGKPKRFTLGKWPEMSPESARAAFHAKLGALPAPGPQKAGGLAHAAPPETITFAELAERFMAGRAIHFKPSTIGPFTAYLNAQLLPAFGALEVGKITPAILADWFHRYSRSRPGGANQALGHFATILNWGKANGHLPEGLPNPAASLRKNRRAARGRMLSFAQLTALGRELTRDDTRNWQAHQALRLILLTGCRRGEILSLKWSDVKRTRLALPDAKSGARDVPLSAEAREVITDLKRRTGNQTHVFPSGCAASGRTESLDGAWARLKHQAGLPPDIRIHDLRHTYASHAILAGESLPMTGRLLGHRSASSTKRYTHLDGTTLAKAADKLARQIDKLMAG